MKDTSSNDHWRKPLEIALAHIDTGGTPQDAAVLAGVKYKSLWRWLKRVKECDGDIEAALEPLPTGRPVMFAPNDFEINLARWYRLTKESLTTAAYFFARDTQIYPGERSIRPEIQEIILEIEERSLKTGKVESWPDSIRRAFRVTAQEKADFRGRKHGQQQEMITRRGMFEILEDGSIKNILPGETWEMDDYSTNQPYLYRCPQTGQVLLGRQVLACRDLCSPKWLGFDHIGRPRDAYRGEDIPRTILRLILAHGKPKRLRLERGSWESSFVHGIEVEGMASRWGDLRDIMAIEHVFKSKGKGGIEGGFNVLQRWLAHTGTDIGRSRGEFEEATRRLRQVQTTGVDPQSLGFLTQEASSIAHEEAGALINSRPMTREHLEERVSPDDLVARLGWHTTPLKDSEMWYFLPYKAIRTVRAGVVSTSHKESGWPKMYFHVNGIREGVHFESGHQVLIAYDPAQPDLGAYVCNGDLSARNRQGWRMGELLIPNAPNHGLAPQFNASEILSPHLVIRKKAAAATTFRAIRSAAGMPQPGGSREAVVMNGQGGTASVGNLPRPAAPQTAAAAPAAVVGAIPDSVRQLRPQRDIVPAMSSRAMPADPRAEIARLQAELLGQD